MKNVLLIFFIVIFNYVDDIVVIGIMYWFVCEILKIILFIIIVFFKKYKCCVLCKVCGDKFVIFCLES